MNFSRASSLVLVTLFAATPPVFSQDDTVKVFQYDGSLQCGMGQPISLEEMEKKLTGTGVKVVSREKKKASVFVIPLCGAPTGLTNVYEISRDDLAKALNLQFSVWMFDQPTVEVAKYDGSLQCGMGKRVDLDAMEKELVSADVKVLAKAKKPDGMLHIQVCGASTGMMNVYQIQTTDLDKAQAAGFVLWGLSPLAVAPVGLAGPGPIPLQRSAGF